MADNEAPTADTESTNSVDVEAQPVKKAAKKKKNKRTVAYGQMHINATFNNTIITFSDKAGNVLTQASAGGCGFRGSKKGTAYAAQIAAEKAAQAAKQNHSLHKVDVRINGIGQGRETSVRALSNMDIAVESITDITPIAHGGTRPRKARRN